MAFTHNSELADSEPTWGDVDKTALPRDAHADMGEENKKSTWKYPHHHIVGGDEKNDDGVYTNGTMYLHKGGLDAAWSAAQGGRSGEKASQAIIDHLEAHRKVVYKEEQMNQQPIEEITLQSGGLRQQPNKKRREYRCSFIKAGRAMAKGARESNLLIPAQPLKDAVAAGLFNSRASFLNHIEWLQDNQDLRTLVGVSINSEWNDTDQSVDGVIRFYDTPLANELADMLDQMLEDQKTDQPVPDVGLSIIAYFRFEFSENGGSIDRSVTAVNHIETIDWVFGPAAEGRMKEALSRLSQATVTDQQTIPPAQEPEQTTPPVQTEPTTLAQKVSSEPAPVIQQPVPEAASAQATPDPISPWMKALKLSTAMTIIANSGLPQITQDKLRAMSFETPEELNAQITAEREYLAALTEATVINLGSVPPREPSMAVGRNSLEKVDAALIAMLDGVRPQDGIQPLSGVREFYHLLSGDYEMTGVFQPERVMLANVNTSTMAGMIANALNKKVVNAFQIYPKWWKPITLVDNFSNLQEVKWITLGGIGELPTVAEGAAYTEMTWDDQTETATFTKKGGYLGITLEAIDKDDTGKLRAAPKALAQAAWLTLSKAISNIFTTGSGVGPTLSSDSTVLFHSNHSNLGTSALSFTSWEATRKLMRQQTELNSSERLGALTAPKYLLVPSDLEITALQILMSAYEPGHANNDENPLAEGNTRNERLAYAKSRVIVVDLWTDANNWAAAADPNLYPTIGLGFRYGQTPEVFSVASPTAGLMFTNDVMPIKVRFFFATGPMDYRGLYKHNVT